MNSYTQANRALSVTTPAGKDVLLVLSLRGQEGLSQLFHFELDLVAENAKEIAFDKLLGQSITASLTLPNKSQRHFNGICNRFRQGRRETTFTHYRMEIVPKFWLLTRRAQSRIFQHITVPDILKKVLTGLDVVWELQGTFQPRDYCVQYRETDFNFASRLMEEEGIYYYFKHSAGGHQMVVANTPQSHVDLPGASKLIYEEVSGGTREEDRITAWEKVQELRSGKITLWDHCFELPHKHLEADRTIADSVQAGKVSHAQKLSANGNLEIYDYPGAYAQRFDGVDRGGGERPADVQKIFEDNKRTVNIRMQEEAAKGLLINGLSNCRHLVAGHKFTLERHWNADGPYVLTEVQHEAELADDYRSGGGNYRYKNQFTCIPAVQPFRPSRNARKPVVQGTQTAVVVGPKGEEIFTDKYGRVKVQFHWDREGKHDAESSCWVRVAQPWAGKRWGASFWPRIGQEVIVDFLEGDPDQPIIVGSVYNADQMPPYLGKGPDSKHPDDNKLTGVKSNTTTGGNGYNEWRFDDTKDKEQIFFHAQRDMDTRVKRDSRELVIHDRHLIVGSEEKKEGDQRELVYRDKHLNVKRHHTELIEGNMQLTVGGGSDGGNVDVVIKKDRKEKIDGGADVLVAKDRNEKVGGGQSLTVGGDQNEKVGKNHALEAGMAIHIKAGMTLVLEAGTQLTLKVGGNFIDINPSGVAIQGTMVMINSGGAAGSGAGAQPKEPAQAKDAKPTKPDLADDAKSGQKSAP